MIKFSLDKMSYQAWRDYAKYSEENNVSGMIECINTAIVSWDYDVPVSLGLGGLPNMVLTTRGFSEFTAHIKDWTARLEDNNPVQVDLSLWDFSRFQKFEAASKTASASVVTEYFTEVCDHPSLNANDRDISAELGIMCIYAIQKEYLRNLSGNV